MVFLISERAIGSRVVELELLILEVVGKAIWLGGSGFGKGGLVLLLITCAEGSSTGLNLGGLPTSLVAGGGARGSAKAERLDD